jgi:hypothetical protein
MKWPIARLLASTVLPFAVLVLAVGWVFTALVVLAVSAFRDVRISGWDVAAPQARWLMFILGLHVARKLLQVAVAHGRTRREFMAQATAFTVVLTAASAALVTLGYALESVVYRIAGWPQTFDERHFATAADVGPIFLGYWAVFAVWIAAAMLVSSGFDRLEAGGFLTLLIGFALAVPTVFTLGASSSLPFLGRLGITAQVPFPLTVTLCAVSWGVGLLLTWGLVRDIPVKSRSAA